METLIFNGSPRPNGDTASLLRELKNRLTGPTVQVDAYACGVSPCVDCRHCRDRAGCAIRDGWDDIDSVLRRCTAVVIATPLYFSQPTGPLLSLLSRTQQYFSARHFRKEDPGLSPKRGGILLVGGGDGSPDRAAETAGCLLRLMGCKETAPYLCCHRTDTCPAPEEPGIPENLDLLAEFLEGKEKTDLTSPDIACDHHKQKEGKPSCNGPA